MTPQAYDVDPISVAVECGFYDPPDGLGRPLCKTGRVNPGACSIISVGR
ncbi:MAG: hypothetical protein ABI725_05990 [Chloroflexota bacterium]